MNRIQRAQSQDAVIIEDTPSEQDLEEASTGQICKEVSVSDALLPTSNEDDIVEVPRNEGSLLEGNCNLGQRGSCESREASNGTGLLFDEKEEAGPSAETIRKAEEPMGASECGGMKETKEVRDKETESMGTISIVEQPASSVNMKETKEVRDKETESMGTISKVEQPASSVNMKETKEVRDKETESMGTISKVEQPASSVNMHEQKPDSEEPKPLSKSARKNLLKMERYRQTKHQRKAYEKEKRHQETHRKRQEWQVKLAMLPEEEVERAKQEKIALRNARKEERKGKKEKLAEAMETGQNLVIDLEFGEKMKPNEVSSLIQQVMYSYAANGRAVSPCRLSLTGCTGDIRTQLERNVGFPNWLLHKEERSYLEVFQDRVGDLVYLTADSEHVLDKLDASKVYIVGGLVDRNRWKGTTLEKAKNQGIATAKLPIGEHMKMLSSQVLTVNQVVEIVLRYMELGDWGKALLAVIPQRKRAAKDSLERVNKLSRLDCPEETNPQKGQQALDAMSDAGDDVMAAEVGKEEGTAISQN